MTVSTYTATVESSAPADDGRGYELEVRLEAARDPEVAKGATKRVRQRLRIRRIGPAAAFRRGARVLLAPEEAARLVRGPARVRLRNRFIEATLEPAVGGRVCAVALRRTEASVLDAEVRTEVGAHVIPGGLRDGLAGESASIGKRSRYRATAHTAERVTVSGVLGSARVRRTVAVAEGWPVLVAQAALAPKSRKSKAPGRARYQPWVALAKADQAAARFRFVRTADEGRVVEEHRLLTDLAGLRPWQGAHTVACEAGLGALAYDPGPGRASTVLLWDPAAKVRLQLEDERSRAGVRWSFPEAPLDGRPHSVGLAPADRVDVTPAGVTWLAAAPARAGRVTVAVLARLVEPVAEGVGSVLGHAVRLRRESLAGLGSVLAGVVRLDAQAYSEGLCSGSVLATVAASRGDVRP